MKQSLLAKIAFALSAFAIISTAQTAHAATLHKTVGAKPHTLKNPDRFDGAVMHLLKLRAIHKISLDAFTAAKVLIENAIHDNEKTAADLLAELDDLLQESAEIRYYAYHQATESFEEDSHG